MVLLTIFTVAIISMSFYSKVVGEANDCHGFMTVIATRKPWNNDNDEDCAETAFAMDERLRILSAEMLFMKTNLTVYTTYVRYMDCHLNYPGIIVEFFNATELLHSYGFDSPTLHVMSNWSVQGYARTSDVVRLALAHRYRKTYIDPDILFLRLNVTMYSREFVSVCMWANSGPSMELTNSAFCLRRDILMEMLIEQKKRILTGSQIYRYTELGPILFLKTFINNRKVLFYSQNAPKEASVLKVIRSIRTFDHKMLHLTTAIRKAWGDKYVTALHIIRTRLQLPSLHIQQSWNPEMLYQINLASKSKSSDSSNIFSADFWL